MPRTTLDDRARKSRIREREQRQLAQKLKKLDEITDDQIKVLQKIKTAEAKGSTVKADSIADWKELKAMGAVREQDGALFLTSIGAQVVAHGK